MYQEHEIDPRLLKWFNALAEVPPMDETRQDSQRANFMDEAQRLRTAVSKTTTRRHTRWMRPIQSLIQIQKEQKSMFQILGTLILVVTMVLGAGGITGYAAQASLPDQLFYSLKLWSEETLMKFASDGQNWQLALDFAERRAAEIRQMAENGQVPPESLQTRLRLQVEQAIQLAANRSDGAASQALEQVRLRLQTQEQSFSGLQGAFSPQVEAALIQARQTLQERQRWVEAGIEDPNWLREQLRLRISAPQTPPFGQESGQAGTGTCLHCTPLGEQNGGNPWTTGTPTPGSGYGEGQGSNPWTTGTPTPGSGYGPGPGPDASNTCTPAARNGLGVQPTEKPAQTSGGSGTNPNQGGPGGETQPGQGGSGPQGGSGAP
jgi:hypothetical protein